VVGSSLSRQMLALNTPDVNRRWPAMATWEHSSVKPTPLRVNPDTELFNFLGLRELHYVAIDEGSAHNELLIPSWLTAMLLAPPFIVIWRLDPAGPMRHFLSRISTRELTLTSTLLSILLGILWLRSYHSLDILHVQYPDRCRNWSIVGGEISYQSQPIPSARSFAFWIHNPGYHPNGLIHNVNSRLHATEKTERRFLDFQYANLQELELTGSGRTWSLAAPIWFFVYLFATPIALAFRRSFRQRRSQHRGAADAEDPNFPSNRNGRIST